MCPGAKAWAVSRRPRKSTTVRIVRYLVKISDGKVDEKGLIRRLTNVLDVLTGLVDSNQKFGVATNSQNSHKTQCLE